MKPEKPITRKEMYLDVATGGSTELPSPVTREEKYLAKIAGESVDIPTPVTRYEMLLAAVAGESYTLTPVTRLEIYLAKAAGQDVEIPQPVTREEMYWFDYCGGTPTPPEREYTGAVPVTFIADGTPLLDYLISGNTVQNGTPTPDSPVMPQGTGERTGNLWDEDYTGISGTIIYKAVYVGNGDFTLSTSCPAIEGAAALFFLAGNVQAGAATVGNGVSKNRPRTVASISGYVTIAYRRVSYQSGIADPRNEQTMLNAGSTPLPYEPYGYKLDISSANITTPVYLGEVETTRMVKKLVLTGEETWGKSQSTNTFYIQNTPDVSLTNRNLTMCSHFEHTGQTKGTYGTYYTPPTSVHQFNFVWDESATVEEWKSYLAAQYAAGTPVTVWYVLSTEETGIVNEPLMKIGDYADTLSMEQTGAQIPTANGSTTLDVETTVPPSEIYIKYHGEAVATLSMLSAEVSNPEETAEEKNPEEMEETENGSEDVSLQHEFEAIE